MRSPEEGQGRTYACALTRQLPCITRASGLVLALAVGLTARVFGVPLPDTRATVF